MYCVYITEYSGDKLPRYYIGSTSLDKIDKGYRGSVSSKAYRELWESEPDHLFTTKVIKVFDDRVSALAYELELQESVSAVDNPEYVNMSYAKPAGFFGRDVSGINNPMYGKSRTGERHIGGENISNGLKRMYSETDYGTSMKEESRKRMINNNPTKDPSTIEKMKQSWKKTGRNIGNLNPMYGKKSPMNGKRLYNNGYITKAFEMGLEPDGWILGRHN